MQLWEKASWSWQMLDLWPGYHCFMKLPKWLDKTLLDLMWGYEVPMRTFFYWLCNNDTAKFQQLRGPKKRVISPFYATILTLISELLGHAVPSYKGWGGLLVQVGFPNTFISSRLAGKTPGLRFESELFGRVGAGVTGGAGGAVGRDTTMEVGRVPLCPSATGLQWERDAKNMRSLLHQEII